jgi:branched-chain amino acid transport system ATP-binding protein
VASPLLAVRGLVKRFGGIVALAGVDLEVAGGELLGLIGPNGSGKTTLVNCVSGVLHPTDGNVFFDEQDITGWPRTRRARAGLVRTFQNLRLFTDLTVSENVEAGRFNGRSQAKPGAVRTVLRELGLERYERTRAADLPYGYQRRVELGRALLGEPRLLLLDEPAAGLSDVEQEELRDTLVESRTRFGCSMLVIDHDMSFMLSVCERIVAFHEGRSIFSGSPAQALVHPEVVEAYLGLGEVPDA